MGIFLHLAVSKAVTKSEWEKAYQETLVLVEKLPLAERREKTINGINVICLTHSKEREYTFGRYDEKVKVGWFANGDLDSLKTAEDYFLSRNLVSDETYDPDAGDALLDAIPSYTSFDWEDKRFQMTYSLWGAKTQGEPYHIYLLAIACLLEARLGDKVFIYGDITKGQCEQAVRVANRYLNEKITVPDRCCPKKLLHRIAKLNFTEAEKAEIFDSLYLGKRDTEYGKAFCEYFSDDAQKEYWKMRFAQYSVDVLGFERLMHDFLTCGFNLSLLCEVVECRDKNGNEAYERFIRSIMDTKLYLKEKDCRDALTIDQDEESTYGIWTLMAQFAFSGAHNSHVDRYIPLDEIRKVLTDAFACKCDVNSVIDCYLAEEEGKTKPKIDENTTEESFAAAVEADAAGVFNDIMDRKREEFRRYIEEFDISDYSDLRYYETGQTINPALLDNLKKNFAFYDGLTKEPKYIELLSKGTRRMCEWLIEQNRSILIRDTDWEKIFSDIEADKESFRRYYPMVRIELTTEGLVDLILAIVLNDDVYALCRNYT